MCSCPAHFNPNADCDCDCQHEGNLHLPRIKPAPKYPAVDSGEPPTVVQASPGSTPNTRPPSTNKPPGSATPTTPRSSTSAPSSAMKAPSSLPALRT